MMQTGNLIDVGARTRIPAQRKPGRADLALWDAAKQEAIDFAPSAASPATARAPEQAPAVTAKRPRGSGGQPEGKNKPRFSAEADLKHKLRFAVLDGGRRISGNLDKQAARKEAARLEKELKGA